MNTVNRFAKIICSNRIPSRGNRPCGMILFDMQVDTQNTVRRACRNCGKLMEYTADGEGGVTKEVLSKKVRFVYDDSVAIVEIGGK